MPPVKPGGEGGIAAWLREEAHETWHHFICDVFVYVAERPKLNNLIRPISPSYSYRSGHMWLELRINTEDADYIAIIERDVNAPLKKHLVSLRSLWSEGIRQSISPTHNRNLPMFVDDVELMQSPQELHSRVVPEVIRLQRLDFVLRWRRDFLDLSRAIPC